MSIPRLTPRIVHDRAYCGRCGGLIGTAKGTGRVPIHLAVKRGHGWVFTPIRGDTDMTLEYRLRRRRHPVTGLGGPTNQYGTLARGGEVIVCPYPKCMARQVVP